MGPAPSPRQDRGPGVSAGPTGHRPQCAWASGFASSARTPGTGRSQPAHLESQRSSFDGAPEPTCTCLGHLADETVYKPASVHAAPVAHLRLGHLKFSRPLEILRKDVNPRSRLRACRGLRTGLAGGVFPAWPAPPWQGGQCWRSWSLDKGRGGPGPPSLLPGAGDADGRGVTFVKRPLFQRKQPRLSAVSRVAPRPGVWLCSRGGGPGPGL